MERHHSLYTNEINKVWLPLLSLKETISANATRKGFVNGVLEGEDQLLASEKGRIAVWGMPGTAAETVCKA